MSAHEVLAVELAQLLATDVRPPCCDGSGRWLAEDADVRVRAAEECTGCPLAEPCGAAGLVESWGIWGGQDVSVRPSRRRDRKVSA